MNDFDKVLDKIENKKIVYVIKKMIDKYMICSQKELPENFGLIRGALIICNITNQISDDDVDYILEYLGDIAFNRYKHRI